ncbi:unnamed protein product [Brassica oleracea var. botrytis]
MTTLHHTLVFQSLGIHTYSSYIPTRNARRQLKFSWNLVEQRVRVNQGI